MNKAEKTAFEAGRTLLERGVSAPAGYGMAPCFDPIMCSLVFEPRSKSGEQRLEKIFRAWYAGAGIPFPQHDG